MRVKNVAQANALVGTRWERDGLHRVVTRVEGVAVSHYDGRTIWGKVFWKRPGGKERKHPQWLPYFNNWLGKAVPVDDHTKEVVAAW